jgi:hypothetical protein
MDVLEIHTWSNSSGAFSSSNLIMAKEIGKDIFSKSEEGWKLIAKKQVREDQYI